ncbi:MAG: AN1-type zinc finger domain-containing protein [Candidatus Heimdallarchaeota archaeon]
MAQCEFPGCETKEALPFKCSYCQKLFCTKHRLPENHNCDKIHLGKQQLPREKKLAAQREVNPISKREERKKKREERRSKTEIGYDSSEDYYYSMGQDGQLYSVKTRGNQKDRLYLSMVADGFTTGWEVLDIIISLVVILFSYGFTSIYMSKIPWWGLGIVLPITMLIFLNTYIPRKLLVKRFGYSSRYLLTRIGFIITIVMILSPIKITFPGMLVIPDNENMTKKQQGISSSIGPIINTVLGVGFILLGWLLLDPSVAIIFTAGAFLNSQITISFLLPLRGTPGQKVFKWSWILWGILIAINLTVFILCFFLGIIVF